MLKDIKHLVLDMDGVLWHGETPLPGLVEFFAALQRLDISFVLATNNSAKSPEQYTEKMARLGLDIPPQQVLTSGEATAAYLAHHYPAGSRVYVIGEEGLRQAMRAQGYELVTADQAAAGAEAALVVVGFNRTVTYPELAMGSLLVHKGAAFYGTNPDPSFPSELGPLPGAGSLQAVISSATGVQPTVIGKPGPILFQEALSRLGSSAANTAMVGDRLSTDIAGAAAVGMSTVLLLSGISQRADINGGGPIPDFVFEDITDLAANLAAANGSQE